MIPVEPEGWDDVGRSLAKGEIMTVGANPPPTQCDALQTFATRPINFAVLRAACPHGLAVNEDEVRVAQLFAMAQLRLVLEPGGAPALAAVPASRARMTATTVVVLSGGNVDPGGYAQAIAAASLAAPNSQHLNEQSPLSAR